MFRAGKKGASVSECYSKGGLRRGESKRKAENHRMLSWRIEGRCPVFGGEEHYVVEVRTFLPLLGSERDGGATREDFSATAHKERREGRFPELDHFRKTGAVRGQLGPRSSKSNQTSERAGNSSEKLEREETKQTKNTPGKKRSTLFFTNCGRSTDRGGFGGTR